jgi:hypothetical protein
MKNEITLPYKPKRGRRVKLKYLSMMVRVQGLVQNCCNVTGYRYEQITDKQSWRSMRTVRLALAHVILASGVERKYAAEATGLTFHTVVKSTAEARKRYDLDDQFRNLCNAIAGKN